MLVHAATTGQKLCFSSSELKCDVDDAFPIDWVTRIVGGRGEARGLNGTDGRVAEAVAEVTGDGQYLDGPGRRDANSDRDIAFDVKLLGLYGVLGLGFKENLGCALGCRSGGSGWLRHRRRSVLSEVDRAGYLARSVHRAGASGDTVRDARDGYWTVAFHVLSGGRAGTKIDNGGDGSGAVIGGRHTGHSLVAKVDGGRRGLVGNCDGVRRGTKRDGGRMRRVVRYRRGHRLGETDHLGGRRRLNQLRRRGKNDRHRLGPFAFWTFGNLGPLDFRHLTFCLVHFTT